MKKSFYASIICLIIPTAAYNVAAQSIVTDGLESYWNFEKNTIIAGKVKDIWGETDGKLMGKPKSVPGYYGDALEFDGLDDFVNLTNLGNFGEQVGTSTFEAWVKIGHNNGEMSLFSVEDECQKWGLKIHSGNNKEKDRIRQIYGSLVDIGEDVPEDRCQGYVSMRFTPVISDGKWHHVVYTRDVHTRNIVGNDGIRQRHSYKPLIYIDTNLISVSVWRMLHSPKYIPFVNPVYLGAAKIRGIDSQFFKGVIDEVRIYNRPLSEEELTQNYKADAGLGVESAEKLPVVWGNLKSKR